MRLVRRRVTPEPLPVEIPDYFADEAPIGSHVEVHVPAMKTPGLQSLQVAILFVVAHQRVINEC